MFVTKVNVSTQCQYREMHAIASRGAIGYFLKIYRRRSLHMKFTKTSIYVNVFIKTQPLRFPKLLILISHFNKELLNQCLRLSTACIVYTTPKKHVLSNVVNAPCFKLDKCVNCVIV